MKCNQQHFLSAIVVSLLLLSWLRRQIQMLLDNWMRIDVWNVCVVLWLLMLLECWRAAAAVCRVASTVCVVRRWSCVANVVQQLLDLQHGIVRGLSTHLQLKMEFFFIKIANQKIFYDKIIEAKHIIKAVSFSIITIENV